MTFSEKRIEVIKAMRPGSTGNTRYLPVLCMPSGREIPVGYPRKVFGCWRIARDVSQLRLILIKRRFNLPEN